MYELRFIISTLRRIIVKKKVHPWSTFTFWPVLRGTLPLFLYIMIYYRFLTWKNLVKSFSSTLKKLFLFKVRVWRWWCICYLLTFSNNKYKVYHNQYGHHETFHILVSDFSLLINLCSSTYVNMLSAFLQHLIFRYRPGLSMENQNTYCPIYNHDFGFAALIEKSKAINMAGVIHTSTLKDSPPIFWCATITLF